MKTVLILAGLVALAACNTFPVFRYDHVETRKLEGDLLQYQSKFLSLLENVRQIDYEAEYYKVGKGYDIVASIENYSDQDAVRAFAGLREIGFMPKAYTFSIFYDRQREEAKIIYDLFYSAKDLDTFYKTVAYGRIYFNEYQFMYAFYAAIIQRSDTTGIVLPAPYELYPEYFLNMYTIHRMYRTQMQSGIFNEEVASNYGIWKMDNNYYYYYNYSNPLTYRNQEYRLSYLTEDIGWNSYYYYFHNLMPFWGKGEDFIGIFKERRGEFYYYFYQQLLSRYYLERLSNGLGEIPDFSWYQPLRSGYYPAIYTSSAYPFAQRPNYYYMGIEENVDYIQFLDAQEKSFVQFLQIGQFKAFKQDVDFRNSKSINFVGNFWQGNPDLYDKYGREVNYDESYEIIARRVLGAAPPTSDNYEFVPSALDFYQTSLRDPAFYMLYNKIMSYIVQYKEWLEPYDQEVLHYSGVKINDVSVGNLTTFFEYYDFNATNAVFLSDQEIQQQYSSFIVRQPRLNHEPFSVTIDVKSDVEAEAVFKIFVGPKYDGEGRPLSLEDNWMNFVELDWFTHKLTSGQNKVERKSEEFFFFKEDSVSMSKIYELLKQGQVPESMSEDYDSMPSRLMLPRGTPGGFPVQFFVFVYPYQALSKDLEAMKNIILDNKPLGYPFDRPVEYPYLFLQPNMYFEDVNIYHRGPQYPWWSNGQFRLNEVPRQ
ncbi:arylphorin-like [Plodia interpunctella]|uniref:arylphorin-like n=1 Tax=Plodia interpunctella TaxID=58824 RepID=UPI002367B8BE|nr:arylphorin-like [Plodia interpunctella]